LPVDGVTASSTPEASAWLRRERHATLRQRRPRPKRRTKFHGAEKAVALAFAEHRAGERHASMAAGPERLVGIGNEVHRAADLYSS
jgi:hypothetical protein